jgi:hypothetical protein
MSPYTSRLHQPWLHWPSHHFIWQPQAALQCFALPLCLALAVFSVLHQICTFLVSSQPLMLVLCHSLIDPSNPKAHPWSMSALLSFCCLCYITFGSNLYFKFGLLKWVVKFYIVERLAKILKLPCIYTNIVILEESWCVRNKDLQVHSLQNVMWLSSVCFTKTGHHLDVLIDFSTLEKFNWTTGTRHTTSLQCRRPCTWRTGRFTVPLVYNGLAASMVPDLLL